MSKTRKDVARPKIKAAPPVLMPVVTRNAPEFKLTDAEFAALEKAGNITLHAKHRSDLLTLAARWIFHDQTLQSARPKQFRNRLNQISDALEKAREVSDINTSNAPALDRHLLNWAISIPGASSFYTELLELEQQIKAIEKTVATLQNAIPPDHGKMRPHNDARMILHLANIYEAAGGKARVYPSTYEKDGWADTLFRRFAHNFYSQLPLSRRRAPSGLVNALRDALSQGRKPKKGDLP